MAEPLQLWQQTPTRQAILEFVNSVTTPNSPDFISGEERIAVFDNDGTLWCEKPMYIQLDHLLRKLAAQAEREPALREKQPWQAAWEQDYDWLGEAVTKHYQGDDSSLQVVLSGIVSLSKDQPAEQVEAEARNFVENERHPKLELPYKDCIYQPMVELLRYLEAHGFHNYLVSGGGRDFMRGIAADLYGIPRQRVLGSTVAYRFIESEHGGEIVQRPELDVVDDGPAKPVQIWNLVGRRPILAAGNSNGDIAMLKFTEGSKKPFLNLLLNHDDPIREFEYNQGAEKALELAAQRGWTVISMHTDWKEVFYQSG